MERHIASLEALRTEPLSDDAINAAHQDLQSFFIQTYHLEDALKETASSMSPQDVEDAITNDPDLALLADLANLDKHYKLTKPPRSSDRPAIVNAQGVIRRPPAVQARALEARDRCADGLVGEGG